MINTVKGQKLTDLINDARFIAEVALDEPVNIAQTARDALRLQKFLDDFLYNEFDNKPRMRTLGKARRERFDLDDSCKLRRVIQARIERYNKQLSAYVKANS